MSNIDERKLLAQEEFREIINTYILPLLDVRGKLTLVLNQSKNKELISFTCNDRGKRVVRFYPCLASGEGYSPFYCEVGTYSTDAIKKSLIAILKEILKVAEYRCINDQVKKQRNYGIKTNRRVEYKKRALNLAFEVGMCSWIASGYEQGVILYSIICRMLDWAGKTYEGKAVPFGIVINFEAEAEEDAASYLQFLENNSSAVFSDGIFSGILLDKKGKLLSFLTRNTPIAEGGKNEDIFVPYKFLDIAKHCYRNSVGIIVPANGEILLIKNRALCFAKRGNKWTPFDWQRVYTKLRPYFLTSGESDEKDILRKIKIIYGTLLDVSFSHTGGCLAIVLPDVPQTEISKVIQDRFDLSLTGNLPSGVSKENKEKIEILKYLLTDKDNNIRSFFEIDKELRKEILSLDGATVVALDGSFYCAGSIVSVPGGSSGGGRTAAAKRLAELGVGIKISEDGYIEAYGSDITSNEDKASNSRLVQLFKFK